MTLEITALKKSTTALARKGILLYLKGPLYHLVTLNHPQWYKETYRLQSKGRLKEFRHILPQGILFVDLPQAIHLEDKWLAECIHLVA